MAERQESTTPPPPKEGLLAKAKNLFRRKQPVLSTRDQLVQEIRRQKNGEARIESQREEEARMQRIAGKIEAARARTDSQGFTNPNRSQIDYSTATDIQLAIELANEKMAVNRAKSNQEETDRESRIAERLQNLKDENDKKGY